MLDNCYILQNISFYVTIRVISFRLNIPSNILYVNYKAQNITKDIFSITHQYSVWFQIFWNSHDFILFFSYYQPQFFLYNEHDVGNEQSSTLTPKAIFSLFIENKTPCVPLSPAMTDLDWATAYSKSLLITNPLKYSPPEHPRSHIMRSVGVRNTGCASFTCSPGLHCGLIVYSILLNVKYRHWKHWLSNSALSSSWP